MNFQSVNDMLRQLQQSDWTACLGQPVNNLNVRILDTWNEVVELTEDDEMIDLLSEQTNLIRDDVSKNMSVYRLWNEFAQSLRPEVEELIQEKILLDRVGPDHHKKVCQYLRGDIVLAAIEVYYRAYTRRDFHQSMIRWLLKGHIPVGWELGNYPEGRPIVY
jgi:hypothetical protein